MYVSYFFISQDMYVMSLRKKMQASVIKAVLSNVIEFMCSFKGNRRRK